MFFLQILVTLSTKLKKIKYMLNPNIKYKINNNLKPRNKIYVKIMNRISASKFIIIIKICIENMEVKVYQVSIYINHIKRCYQKSII